MTSRTPIRAKDIMVTSLVTIREEMDLHEAGRLLVKNKISGAPVVDDDRRLLGILTEKDLMSVLLDAVYDVVPSTKVKAYMQRKPCTIGEELDLLSIAQIFQQNPYRRLPVLRDGRLVGQISRRDVLRAVLKLIEPAPDRQTALLYLSALKDPGDEAPIE